jgi:hypothetical protein
LTLCMTVRFSILRPSALFLLCALLLFAPALLYAQSDGAATERAVKDVEERGIVQCGNNNDLPCNVCDFFQTASRLVNFVLFGLMTPLAAGIFIWGGALLLTSRGSETQRERGKKTLAGAVIGLFIAFAAWAIINTIIKTIARKTDEGGQNGVVLFWENFPACTPSQPAASLPLPPVPRATTRQPGATETHAVQTDTQAVGRYTDEEARERLARADIEVNSTTRTSLDGIAIAAIEGALNLKRRCQCDVVITGGTESGHSGSGAGTHAGGDKLDFRITPTLESYIIRDPDSGLVFVREGDHFDVCFNNCRR